MSLFQPLHSILVIFQFTFSTVKFTIFIFLYIPFWLYSNSAFSRCLFCLFRLYIPFWLYSNSPLSIALAPFSVTLHSILVIFQSVSYHTTYLRHLKPYFLSTSIFSAGKVWFSCNSTVYVLL